MSKVFIPANKPEDWASFLADPKHWKTGYSAKTLAYAWHETDDFPPNVKQAFKQSNSDIFRNIEMLFAIPEYKVRLPGGRRPSQNDIFVIAKGNNQLVGIMVEGKVSEDFDKTIAEWKTERDIKTNKEKRLHYLLQELSLKEVPDNSRYQLLHRTASAIIEARRFNARNALMLIHSFSQTYEHFEDYNQFLTLFGLIGKKDALVGPISIKGISLYFGWVKGDSKFLAK